MQRKGTWVTLVCVPSSLGDDGHRAGLGLPLVFVTSEGICMMISEWKTSDLIYLVGEPLGNCSILQFPGSMVEGVRANTSSLTSSSGDKEY